MQLSDRAAAEDRAFRMSLTLTKALLAFGGAGLLLLPVFALARPLTRADVAPAFAGMVTGFILTTLAGWLIHLAQARVASGRRVPQAMALAPHVLAIVSVVALLVGAGFALNAVVREAPCPC